MPEEIEIKLKLDSHDPIRQRLKDLAATPQGKVRETNIFFDRNNGELRQRDQGLRVRHSLHPDGTSDTLLTFKGPAANTGLRTREAFDVHTSPGDQTVPMLLAMGYEQILLFEKDRETWHFAHCLIELDTLPHFGCFVEIEGPSVDAVLSAQTALGLREFPPHRTSYSKMVAEETRARGTRELRF